MVHLNATTPQLKAVEQLADAIAARSLINAESTLAKDFIMRTFPKTAEFPDLSKEDYLQRYGLALPLFAKAEVRTQHLGTPPPPNSVADIRNSQVTFHDVIEAPMKVVMHVRPSLRCHVVSDRST